MVVYLEGRLRQSSFLFDSLLSYALLLLASHPHLRLPTSRPIPSTPAQTGRDIITAPSASKLALSPLVGLRPLAFHRHL